MSIRRRLITGLVLLIVVSALSIGGSVGVGRYTTDIMDRLQGGNFVQLEQISHIHRKVDTLQSDSSKYASNPNPFLRAQAAQAWATANEATEDYVDRYVATNPALLGRLQAEMVGLQLTNQTMLDRVDASAAAVSVFNQNAANAERLLNRQLDFIAGGARDGLIELRLRMQELRVATYQFLNTRNPQQRFAADAAGSGAEAIAKFGQEGFPTALVQAVLATTESSRLVLDRDVARDIAIFNMNTSVGSLFGIMDQLSSNLLQDSAAASTSIQDAAYVSRVVVPVLGLLFLMVSLLAGVWVWRGVTGLLALVVSSSAAVQRGDYSPMPHHERGETAALITAFNAMVTGIEARDRALNAANTELGAALQRAEDASRLKSQFLATMSHELRTPMTGILGFVQMLQRGVYGTLSPDVHEALQSVDTNGQHLLRLINDVLDIARIESGKVHLQLTSLSLQHLTETTLQATHPLAAQKAVRLYAVLDPALPPTMLGDDLRLRQIVINFLSNAIKFTEEGEVELRIRLLDPTTWQIAVRDTGVGIAPEHQEIVWEHFRQVDGSTSRFYAGTGLGLAIVRELVHLMGGTVGLESAIGHGSTFTATLPLLAVDQHLARLPAMSLEPR